MDIDPELVKGTIEDLRRSLTGLLQERTTLDSMIEATNARLATWERKLEESKTAKDSRPAKRSRDERRPKGANKRAITDFLAARLNGATPSAIQKGTGLPWSSVRGTLSRNTEIYVEEAGLWRLRNPPRIKVPLNGLSPKDVAAETVAEGND
jgi:hypothetical protein